MFFRYIWAFFKQAHALQLQAEAETALIGGQAVMEGVMMRSPGSYCVAVRLPDSNMATQEGPIIPMTRRSRLWRWPVLRGLYVLGSAMSLGMKALRFSVECATGTKQNDSKAGTAAQIVVSLLFALVLYKFVPLYLATKLGQQIPALGGRTTINLIDGLLRLGIFVAFMWLLSRMPDMYRLFQYHGAEHRVVFNFESGQPVAVENAQRFPTLHPRCGTSFLVVVLLISLVLYAPLPLDTFGAKLTARLLLLPLVVGLSYEALRFAARNRNGLLAIITRPGLWLQRITTKPPSDDQVRVAIRALEGAMELEKQEGGLMVIA